MIQLHRLEGFYRVAVEGGYARAARAFPYPITQPAVHQQVRKLEQDLETKLFTRVAKDRVVPTRAGRRLFEFCAPFFAGLPSVVRSIQNASAAGVLRIDAADLEIRHVMPAWIRRLHEQHPDIRVEVDAIVEPDHARLVTGRADIVVDYQPELPDGVSGAVVGTHRTFLALPGDHRLAKRKRVDPSALAGEPFVAFLPGTRHHAMQMHGLSSHGVEPPVVTSAATVDAILALVQAGMGYTVVPWPVEGGPKLRGVATILQTGPGTEFPITAAYRSQDDDPDPVVQAALACAP